MAPDQTAGLGTPGDRVPVTPRRGASPKAHLPGVRPAWELSGFPWLQGPGTPPSPWPCPRSWRARRGVAALRGAPPPRGLCPASWARTEASRRPQQRPPTPSTGHPLVVPLRPACEGSRSSGLGERDQVYRSALQGPHSPPHRVFQGSLKGGYGDRKSTRRFSHSGVNGPQEAMICLKSAFPESHLNVTLAPPCMRATPADRAPDTPRQTQAVRALRPQSQARSARRHQTCHGHGHRERPPAAASSSAQDGEATSTKTVTRAGHVRTDL